MDLVLFFSDISTKFGMVIAAKARDLYGRAKRTFDKLPPAVKSEMIKQTSKAVVNKGLRTINAYNKRVNRIKMKGRKNRKLLGNQSGGTHNDLSVKPFPNDVTPGKLQKNLGYYTYKVTRQNIFFQSAGVQLICEARPIVLKSQFNGTVDTGAASNNFPDDPFLLNPYIAPNTNAIYAAGPNVAKTNVIGLNKVVHEMTILNMETSALEVRVLWCLCKDDTNLSPVNAWNEGIFNSSENQVIMTYRSNFSNQTSAGAGDNPLSFGNLPFKNKIFKKFWKVVGDQNFVLQGGDQKRLGTIFNYKKFISRQVVLSNPETNFMAGYSIVPLIIGKGCVVGVAPAGNPPGPSQEVTYSSCRIGILQTDSYVFAGIPPSAADIRTRRVEGQMAVLDAGVVERIIDDEDEPDTVKGI